MKPYLFLIALLIRSLIDSTPALADKSREALGDEGCTNRTGNVVTIEGLLDRPLLLRFRLFGDSKMSTYNLGRGPRDPMLAKAGAWLVSNFEMAENRFDPVYLGECSPNRSRSAQCEIAVPRDAVEKARSGRALIVGTMKALNFSELWAYVHMGIELVQESTSVPCSLGQGWSGRLRRHAAPPRNGTQKASKIQAFYRLIER